MKHKIIQAIMILCSMILLLHYRNSKATHPLNSSLPFLGHCSGHFAFVW